MPRGDLWRALAKDCATPRALGWGGRLGKQIALDVAKGLAFLHHNKVIHLDLKSPNVLLDQSWHAKIADVGLARVTLQSAGTMGAQVESNWEVWSWDGQDAQGTPCHLALLCI